MLAIKGRHLGTMEGLLVIRVKTGFKLNCCQQVVSDGGTSLHQYHPAASYCERRGRSTVRFSNITLDQ